MSLSLDLVVVQKLDLNLLDRQVLWSVSEVAVEVVFVNFLLGLI